MAVAPARHVAAGRLAPGIVFCPADVARNDFHLAIGQRGLLGLGEAAHIVMGEADVVLQLLRQLAGGGLDLLARRPDFAVVAVELFGVGEGRFLAAGLDFVEDALHRFALRRARIVGRGLFALLEIGAGHGSLSYW
jgi:hypothetical protein